MRSSRGRPARGPEGSKRGVASVPDAFATGECGPPAGTLRRRPPGSLLSSGAAPEDDLDDSDRVEPSVLDETTFRDVPPTDDASEERSRRWGLESRRVGDRSVADGVGGSRRSRRGRWLGAAPTGDSNHGVTRGNSSPGTASISSSSGVERNRIPSGRRWIESRGARRSRTAARRPALLTALLASQAIASAQGSAPTIRRSAGPEVDTPAAESVSAPGRWRGRRCARRSRRSWRARGAPPSRAPSPGSSRGRTPRPASPGSPSDG